MALVTRKVALKLLFRFLICFQKTFSTIAWALGPVCVLVAFCLISLVIYVYFTGILPYYLSENGNITIPFILHFMIAIWLSYNLPFNYYMCISTNPGRAPMVDMSSVSPDEEYCEDCNTVKPIRAHHCTVCNKCTLRMDHHCPWMANCIGHYNYKYFVLFLFYMAISTFYVFTLCILPIEYGGVSTSSEVPFLGNKIINFIMVLCISVSVAVGGMFLWHIFLIATQQTTIEFYQNQIAKFEHRNSPTPWVNIFSVGIRKNFEAVFGHNCLWFRWLLPSTSPPPGDGITFWTVYSILPTSNNSYKDLAYSV